MAADKDVFQMFRTKSDADLAEVGLHAWTAPTDP